MEIYVNTLPTGYCIYSKHSIFRIRPVFILSNVININYYQIFLINVKQFWSLMRGYMMQGGNLVGNLET